MKYSKQQLANRYTDGAEIGGNMLTKFYSQDEIKKMFNKFSDIKIEIYDNYDILDNFPHRFSPLGKFLPLFVKKWASQKWGLSFWITGEK